MAGASDKARFYLEQYVPELQESERKGIFTREEVASIASRRSDFEHILNARGSSPSDYARYATYEINLDSLRKKRSKRLGVKSTTFSGQRTIFFILDRATKKFPGDIGLWMQYINFCQREKANKKLAKVFTNVLRLKPRDWSLWVLAAKHYAETQGDISSSRSYLQRGLRFCKNERKLWLEYMRMEMVYLAKLTARRKILGLDEQRNRIDAGPEKENEDVLMLPTITAEDISPDESQHVEGNDMEALEKLASAPAFTGAIPLAIYDAAMKQFNDRPEVSEEFFDLCSSFGQLPSTERIQQHILDYMHVASPDSVETIICAAKMQISTVESQSADFPDALSAALGTIKNAQKKCPNKDRAKMAERAALMLVPFLKTKEDLDEDVVRVLEISISRYLRQMSELDSRRLHGKTKDAVSGLIARLRNGGREFDADILELYADAMHVG